MDNNISLYDLNSTLYFQNLSSDSDSPSPLIPFSVFKISVSVLLSLIILFAVIGNSFVITAFCLNARLRKPSNYFILNLAVTDLSLAVLILPISAVYDVLDTWLFGAEICLIWTVMDVFVSTASILTLVAISADRYMAISNSLLYPKMINGKRVALIISVIYFVSLTISIPPILGWRKQHYETGICYLPHSTGYVVYSAIGSFYLPFIIISVLYYRIYKVAKSHMKSIKKRSVVGSLLDLDGGEGGGEMERSDSRNLFFADDKSMNRRLTSSSSGYSSGRAASTGQRFSQISRSTTDTLNCQPMSGSRYSLSKQDSSDTLMVPGAGHRGRYLFISPMSSRSSRSSGSVSVSDFDGSNLAVPRDSMRSSRSSSSSYGADMESDLIRDYFKQNLVIPRASYVSQTSSNLSRTKRMPISRRLKRFMLERKAAKTVSIMVGAFMICWVPFSIVYLLNGICKKQCGVSDIAFKICFWLGYVNSVLNPIIYSAYNKDMKSAFLRMLGPLCCGWCGRYPRRIGRFSSTKSSVSMASFASIGDSEWQYGETSASANEQTTGGKPADKHLARQVRQSMPTASCPVQVYINEPRKSRAGSIVSWSMAALRGTLHEKLTELDRQSSEDNKSIQSDKSVVLPAVSFNIGGEEADTESQASTLERCHNQQNPAPSKSSLRASGRRGSILADDSLTSQSTSPRSQRRRSSAIFLTPDGDGGWASKYQPLERDYVRRSSKVPSLEDIQETLSQGTRRSSDETSSNVTRQNSLDQVRNPSFDGTSSANSTLQDSRKSSGIGASLGVLALDTTCAILPLVTIENDLPTVEYSRFDEGQSTWGACPSVSDALAVRCGTYDKEDQNTTLEYLPRSSLEYSRSSQTSPETTVVANPSEGILVTLLQDKEGENSYKTLRLCINSLPRQQIQNIQIVLNNSGPQGVPEGTGGNRVEKTCNGGASCNLESLSTINDEGKLQKSSSDSCLLPGHVTKQKLKRLRTGTSSNRLARECVSTPERRKRYDETYTATELDSPDEEALKPSEIHTLSAKTGVENIESPFAEPTEQTLLCSSSTLSSLGLDNFFVGSSCENHPQVETEDVVNSVSSVQPKEQIIHIWRSKSEPILNKDVRNFDTITPKYAQYLQGFINRKTSTGRRDSVVSSINTDYTYEDMSPSVIGTEYEGFSQRGSVVSNTLDPHNEDATPSMCGTDYDGNSSQRSSLTSNNDETPSNNQWEVEADCEDIMVPAIHVTETDDITTVIQASAKYPSPRSQVYSRSASDSRLRPGAGAGQTLVSDITPGSPEKVAAASSKNADIYSEHSEQTFLTAVPSVSSASINATLVDQALSSVTGLVKSGTAEKRENLESVEWMKQNLPTIQDMVSNYIQEIVKKLMSEKSQSLSETHDTASALDGVTPHQRDTTLTQKYTPSAQDGITLISYDNTATKDVTTHSYETTNLIDDDTVIHERQQGCLSHDGRDGSSDESDTKDNMWI